MYSLGKLLLDHPELSQSPDEATERLLAAAEGGYWQASMMLGVIARDGMKSPVDMAAAYHWFTIAIRQGGPDVEKQLGQVRDSCAARLTADSREIESQKVDMWLQGHSHVDWFVLPAKARMSPFPAEEIQVISDITTKKNGSTVPKVASQ
jgi:hypothetical protein